MTMTIWTIPILRGYPGDCYYVVMFGVSENVQNAPILEYFPTREDARKFLSEYVVGMRYNSSV